MSNYMVSRNTVNAIPAAMVASMLRVARKTGTASSAASNRILLKARAGAPWDVHQIGNDDANQRPRRQRQGRELC